MKNNISIFQFMSHITGLAKVGLFTGVDKREIYKIYLKFCKDTNHECVGRNDFYRNATAYGLIKKRVWSKNLKRMVNIYDLDLGFFTPNTNEKIPMAQIPQKFVSFPVVGGVRYKMTVAFERQDSISPEIPSSESRLS